MDRRRSRVAGTGLVVGLVLWTLAALVTLIVSARQTPPDLARPPGHVVAPVRAGSEVSVADVGLQLEWSAPVDILAPAWSGVVTAVEVTAGQLIRDGQPIAVVDRVQRFGFSTNEPFSRPLGDGDSGADAGQLNALLARLGDEHGDGNAVTAATVRGIEAYARRIGAAPTDVFDPSWVVYLPSAELTISTVAVHVSAPAPGAGTPLFTSVPTLVGASVVRAAALDHLVVPGGDAATSTATATRPGAADLVAVPDGAELRFGDLTLSVDASGTAVDPAGLVSLAGRVPAGTAQERASIVRPSDRRDVFVPAGAVRLGASGAACVVTVVKSSDRVVPVEVIASLPNQIAVRGSLHPTDRVRVGGRATPCD